MQQHHQSASNSSCWCEGLSCVRGISFGPRAQIYTFPSSSVPPPKTDLVGSTTPFCSSSSVGSRKTFVSKSLHSSSKLAAIFTSSNCSAESLGGSPTDSGSSWVSSSMSSARISSSLQKVQKPPRVRHQRLQLAKRFQQNVADRDLSMMGRFQGWYAVLWSLVLPMSCHPKESCSHLSRAVLLGTNC